MSPTRTIDVRPQQTLSFQKAFHLVLRGIHHRLLRSALTMAVILLAVAFFMAMLAENVFIQSTNRGVQGEIAAHRQTPRILLLLYTPPHAVQLASDLAGMAEDLSKIHERARVTGWEFEKVSALATDCRWEAIYLDFFDRMAMGKRMVLVKKRKGREIFQYLQDPKAFRGFSERMAPMRDLKIPAGMASFRAFLDRYDAYQERLHAFEVAWRKAIEAFAQKSAELTGSTPIEEWLCEATPEQLEAWRRLVEASGFSLSPATLRLMQDFLQKSKLRQEVAAKLNEPDAKEAWRRVFRENISLDQKMLRLHDPRVLEILPLQEGKGKIVRLEDLAAVSAMIRQEKELASLETLLAAKTEAKSGSVLSGRQIFLLVISFVVCMVGITNAMLMAITERFREIATMKCLGATDGFILTQFMIEAACQGVAGGVLGLVIGLILAFLKGWLQFGSYLLRYFPVGDIVFCMVASLAAGVILAVLASLYPAWAASRMAPMEAMRIE